MQDNEKGRRTVGLAAVRSCTSLFGTAVCAGLTVATVAAAAPAGSAEHRDAPAAEIVWLDSLDLSRMQQRRGTPRARRSIRDQPVTLGGIVYPRGIGTRSISEFLVDLGGEARRFTSTVGVDDAVAGGEGTVTFEVWADDTLVAASGLMRAGDPPRQLEADVAGAHVLTLLVDDGWDTSNGDEVAWADAKLELQPGARARPQPWTPPAEAPPALAPTRHDPRPAIHNPRVTGATPGRSFVFRIPASGELPLRFSVRNLPEGLRLDETTGIITGKLRSAGTTRVEVSVSNRYGRATGQLVIVAGENALARTPPMGWNSWNVWGSAVDQQKVLDAARQLVASGLAAHGFQYVVIDDTWQGKRTANGEIQPNAKFPDMKALADEVHVLGLKLGIYSSPGPRTCEGFEGSWQHEAQDAATYAKWGVDFLKHDWCSYDEIARDRSLPELQKPYFTMRDALARIDRDIVYSLCQYGYGDVWNWGAEVGGNLWRTSGDLMDTWSNLESVGFRQAGREHVVRPGHWNDTDMLVVGMLGWGPNLRPTRLTPNEQMTHLSLWALQAAPLFLGADLSRLDAFTLALLTNEDVLDVNQDPLGKAGGRAWKRGRLEVWTRELADGTTAVGLFNRGLAPRSVTVDFTELGLPEHVALRDLWLRKDLGEFANSFTAVVPRHGVVFVRTLAPAVR